MKRGIIGLTIGWIGMLIVVLLFAGGHRTVSLPLFVEFPAGDEHEKVSVWQSEDGRYYVFLPSYADLSEMTFTIDEDLSVMIDNHDLKNGMSCDVFELNVPYDLNFTNWYHDETTQIMFVQSANVATMHISTASGSMDYIHSEKGNAEESTIRLYDAMGDICYNGARVEIKGRGNATWTEYEKKPYSLQFPEAVDLLQMGAADKWILLANSTDPTHMKNKMIYDFADDLGLAYSPDCQWVDLYLNDVYAGLYLLTERNEIHSERVAIEEDGWLVSAEFESRLVHQNYPHIPTDNGIFLRIHAPRAVTSEQQEMMRARWQGIENALIAADGVDPITGKTWTELIDLDSWARRYLIEEVFANGDGGGISQFYYTPSMDGPTFAGPVWDQDYTLSPRDEWRLSYPNLLMARLNDHRVFWFRMLYQKETFYNYMVSIYQKELRPMVQFLMGHTVREYADEIGIAAAMNQIRWDIPYGLEEELDRSMGYLSQRLEFLDQLWINGTEMVTIQMDSIYAVYRGNLLIPAGTCTGYDLAAPPNDEYRIFKGWFFADTGEPFDKGRLLYEDVDVVAKWDETEGLKVGRVMKLIPLSVITVFGIILLQAEVRRNKRAR